MQPQPPTSPEPDPRPHAGPPPGAAGPVVPGLVPFLGAPAQVPARVRTLALAAGLALLALVGAWCGYEMTARDLDALQTLLHVAPLGVVLAAVLAAQLGTVWRPRSDGRVLEGIGVLGRQGIDLAALIAVAAASGRGRAPLTLRTAAGRLVVDAGALQEAGRPVFDAVGRAIRDGQEQGRFVVPAAVARVWGMPVRPGAPAKGRTGSTGGSLAVVGVLLVALVVGVVLGSD